ncbi:MAG: VWA domain-containing protein [Ilumatobacteraceae bacterium]|nr:VWA domain-containing protein [Actinomycetota bacterium]
MVSRQQMTAIEHFDELSPEVGELDEHVMDRLLADSPDEAVSLLVTLGDAVDPELRAKARRVAERIVIDIARRGRAAQGKVGRLRSLPLRDGGDLDVDAAVESLAESGGSLVDADMLRVIDWERPDTAVCLVIDRSGSMKGEALASAALAAAAVALRAPAFHAVIAFSGTAEVVRSMVTSAHASADGVVDAVLSLKGHGTTNVSDGLRAAITEHEAARCGRHLTVLLSDCRDRAIDEAVPFAQSLEELVIVSPADDIADAQRFAEVTGAALVGVEGPHDVARALDEVLSRK